MFFIKINPFYSNRDEVVQNDKNRLKKQYFTEQKAPFLNVCKFILLKNKDIRWKHWMNNETNLQINSHIQKETKIN